METEDRITSLCNKLISTSDQDEARAIGRKLQDAIHEHIENIRAKVTELPVTKVELFAAD